MKNSVFLPQGTFVKNKFNKIIVASTLGWFVCLIDSCADTFLAGAFLDEMSVSAISLVQPFCSVIQFISYLFAVGTATMFSREMGAFNNDKAYKYVGQGLILSVISAALLVITMILLKDPIMAFYGASEEITALANDYYLTQIFFAAVYPVYFVIYKLVEVEGDDLSGLIACIMSMIGNLGSSIILVQKLGIKGLALGTIIGTAFAILGYSMHFFKKTNSVRVKFQFIPKDILKVVQLSSTTSLTLLYLAVIDIVMNKFIIAYFSEEYLPAYAVINFILNLGAIFASGYEGSNGFVSVAYGENNPANIVKTMKISTTAILIESLVFMGLCYFAAPAIPELYGITNPEVISASVFAFRIIAVSAPATALYYLYCPFYPATEHIMLGQILTGIYMFASPLVLAIPLGLLFGFGGMSVGFMLTSIVADIIIVLVIFLKYGKEAVPFALKKADNECIAYDIYVRPKNITELCEKIKADLGNRNIRPEIVNEVQLIIEESYMTIYEKNGRRKVLSECDLLISDKTLRVITRDNGKIFDITDSDAQIKDLRSYVLARVLEQSDDKTHVTTISFNRNSYLWNLEK